MSGDTLDVAGIRDILRMLPHRYPFVMVDRVIDMRGDDSAIGIKNVTVNEPQFRRAFSGKSGDARRARDRRHGADRGRALPRLLSRSTAARASISSRSTRQVPQAGGARRHHRIPHEQDRAAATCGGIAARPRSATTLIAEAEVGAIITEE